MPSAVCRPALRRLLLVPLLLQYVCLLLSGGLLRCVLLLLLLQVARLWALGTHRRRMLLAAALPAGKQHVEGAARAEGQSTGRLAARQAAPTRCKRPLVNTVPLSCNAPLRPAATRFLPLPAPGHVCHGRLAAAAVAAAGKHPAAQAADVRVVVQEDALGAVLVAHVRLAAADTVEHVSEYLFELALQTTRQREGVGRWQGWLLRRPPSGPSALPPPRPCLHPRTCRVQTWFSFCCRLDQRLLYSVSLRKGEGEDAMVLLPIGRGTRKQRTWSEALCDTHRRRGGSRVPSKQRRAQAGGEKLAQLLAAADGQAGGRGSEGEWAGCRTSTVDVRWRRCVDAWDRHLSMDTAGGQSALKCASWLPLGSLCCLSHMLAGV